MRGDGSVLVTAVLQKELWCVPGSEPRVEVAPVLIHTFEHLVSGIVEVEPDVFIVNLSDAAASHESHLARVDLTGWTPGGPLSPEIIYTFDDRVRALNGSCQVGPGVMLIADSFAGFIGRVDLENNAARSVTPHSPTTKSSLTTIWVEYPPWVIVPSSSTPRYENTLPCINGGQHVRVPEIPHLWLTTIAGLL